MIANVINSTKSWYNSIVSKININENFFKKTSINDEESIKKCIEEYYELKMQHRKKIAEKLNKEYQDSFLTFN